MLRVIRMVCLLALSTGAAAEAMVDAATLSSLEGASQWPVVDVRDLGERSLQPIPGARDFTPELDLAGPVLVVGSDDSAAHRAAAAIEARLSRVQAHWVAGGIDSLRTIRPDLPAGSGTMPESFTIPSDTCQPGEPLHTFSAPQEQQ